MSVGLEALAAIHAEQGYLILNSCYQYEKGFVTLAGDLCIPAPDGGFTREMVDQPMTVVGVATREDFLRQAIRLDELLSVNNSAKWEAGYPYFYKVVATD